MSQLSDLELVAQAMAPTTTSDTASAPPASGSTAAQPKANGHEPSSKSDPIPDDATSLADIDLSKLSPEDRELLQPLIDALRVSDPEGQEGEVPMEDILKQLDAAEGVADDLEGKLDRLIAALGKEEEQIEGGLEKGMKDIS